MSSRIEISTLTRRPGSVTSASELLGELPTRPVVDEVLVELVEDEVDLAFGRLAEQLDEARPRVAAPRVEDDDLFARFPQPVRDPGPEQRALPHAARAIQDGEAIGEQVRGDDLGLALAPEEQKRVQCRLVERRKALVRTRGRGDGHVRAASRTASSRSSSWVR